MLHQHVREDIFESRFLQQVMSQITSRLHHPSARTIVLAITPLARIRWVRISAECPPSIRDKSQDARRNFAAPAGTPDLRILLAPQTKQNMQVHSNVFH